MAALVVGAAGKSRFSRSKDKGVERAVDVQTGKADFYHRPSPLHPANCTAKRAHFKARTKWSMRANARQYAALNPPST
jgi:hypothetical protein